MASDKRGAVLILAGVLAILAIGAGAGAGLYASLAPSTTTTVIGGVASPGRGDEASTTGLTVNAIYQRAYRGVVDLTVTATSSSPFGSSQAQYGGTGFVYDSRGDIVTNEHVVAAASSISVKLWNGQTFPGKLVGSDPSTDLAMIKISAPSSLVHPLTVGDSAALQVGDPVVAIGSPFGFEETVTTGIVSALHRTIDSPNHFTIGDAIQTDAAINHGNSGGPLLNGQGLVIGVNAQLHSDSGGNDGVGFAIPSSTLQSVAPDLAAGKQVPHAYLGVQVGDSTTPPGAQLTNVLPGTPAAKAGLETGDIIVKADGKPITSGAELTTLLEAKKSGDKLSVTYVRLSKPHTVSVTLGSRPA